MDENFFPEFPTHEHQATYITGKMLHRYLIPMKNHLRARTHTCELTLIANFILSCNEPVNNIIPLESRIYTKNK